MSTQLKGVGGAPGIAIGRAFCLKLASAPDTSASDSEGPEAALEWMRHSPRVPLAETAKCIRGVGARHFVLGTDLGQSGNPTPPDGLTMFVAGLQAEGVSREQIQTMGRENPGALLMG